METKKHRRTLENLEQAQQESEQRMRRRLRRWSVVLLLVVAGLLCAEYFFAHSVVSNAHLAAQRAATHSLEPRALRSSLAAGDGVVLDVREPLEVAADGTHPTALRLPLSRIRAFLLQRQLPAVRERVAPSLLSLSPSSMASFARLVVFPTDNETALMFRNAEGGLDNENELLLDLLHGDEDAAVRLRTARTVLVVCTQEAWRSKLAAYLLTSVFPQFRDPAAAGRARIIALQVNMVDLVATQLRSAARMPQRVLEQARPDRSGTNPAADLYK